MKQRLISAGVGVLLLIVVLYFFNTPLVNAVVALLGALAVYELMSAAGYIKNRALTLLVILFAGATAFLPAEDFVTAAYGYVLLLVLLLLAGHEKIPFQEISFTFMIGLLVPFSFQMLLRFRDQFPEHIGFFYVFLALGSSWLTDTGAFYTGSFFGKHKLAPKISPKKTVEGVIGGVVTCTVFALVFAFFFVAYQQNHSVMLQVNYLALLLAAPFFSLTAVVGDLAASVIKRQCSIKDFGHIMPGHGGVLDRFDSVLMVAPLVYLAASHIDFIHLIA